MLFYDEEFICALFDFLRCSSLHYMTWSCDFIFEKISSRAIERHSNWKFFIVLLHLTLTVIAFLSLSETHCVRMYTLLLYNRVSVELNWMKNFVRRRKKRATSSFRQKYYQKNVKLVAFYVVVVIFFVCWTWKISIPFHIKLCDFFFFFLFLFRYVPSVVLTIVACWNLKKQQRKFEKKICILQNKKDFLLFFEKARVDSRLKKFHVSSGRRRSRQPPWVENKKKKKNRVESQNGSAEEKKKVWRLEIL